MNQDRLKDVPFFSTLKKKEMELIAGQADEVDVTAGKVLAKQGDLGDTFFVIESGTADVSRDGEHVTTSARETSSARSRCWRPTGATRR